MISLGVVAVTRDVSIAVMENEVLLSEINLRKEKIDDLIIIIDQALKVVGKDVSEIDEYIVVNGPGSYGGIRNSLTTIKVLALMNAKKLKTVNLLELLAYQNKEYRGLIVATMESRKDELNYGFYGGGEQLNSIIVSDTIRKDSLFPKLLQIKEEFLVIGDLYEVPELNKGIYKAVKPLASEAILLSKQKSELELDTVAPIYSYPVNVTAPKVGTKK
ncbi:MAG: tRNA (adenosine(37)-N6)-threonylcarbamoyltransferase complex dimerization subunit type 1 TsaB [Candidatus Margulisbacteria bacterium]|nr:tRNA (adenosine(37)-N6)-threonylcarbamoyltransferase complex dimerization subunit type 1 TsaB [Candidatus Margulisiibacteriota bacterium]